MDKKHINEVFYKEKNCFKIKEILSSLNESWSFNMLGKISLYEKSIDRAFENFDRANNIAGCAYCEFIIGNIENTKILLNLIRDSSPFAGWLMFLVDLIENRSGNTTYFQVRNFYEQDLELLFLYEQNEKIKKIIQNTEYISNFNKEVYKYCARVLLNNGYYKQAEIMLRNSLSICYNDPETHYMMGEINQKKDNRQEALQGFETAVKVNNGYYPAEQKIKHIISSKKIL